MPLKILVAILLILICAVSLKEREKPADLVSQLSVRQTLNSEEFPLILCNEEPVLKEIRSHPKSPEAYFKLGKVKLCNPFWKDLIGARRAFKKAIALKPDYAEAYYQLGVSYQGFQFGLVVYGVRDDLAVKAFQKAIHIRPDYADAYVGLANSYSELKQYDKAREASQKAHQLQQSRS